MDHPAAAATATEDGGGDETATATCACCGIGEECTARYVARVAVQFGGAWVCGLCAEAIKDEAARRGVGLEAAARAHAEFVLSAAAAARSGPAVQVSQALLQLLKKLLAAGAGCRRLSACRAGGTRPEHVVVTCDTRVQDFGSM